MSDAAPGVQLWPSEGYLRQVERLRAAIGRQIFLIELALSDAQMGVRMTARPYVLLDVVDFPRPDPVRGLAPHLVVLDDGRGVNLGRIARISVERPFGPRPADILYRDAQIFEAQLTRRRRLSRAHIAARSREVLGRLLGARVRLSGSGPAAASGELPDNPADEK